MIPVHTEGSHILQQFLLYLELIEYIHPLMYIIAVVSLSAALAFRLRRRKRSRLKGITLARLRSMSPKEFEHAIADLLVSLGYKDVKVVGGSGDLAVDITARKDKYKVVVQCKRYTSKKVGSPELQMFIGMMLTEYKADKGIFVTTSSFTRDAVRLAERHRVELWDGNRLADMLITLGNK